jgi:hypothetical protein
VKIACIEFIAFSRFVLPTQPSCAGLSGDHEVRAQRAVTEFVAFSPLGSFCQITLHRHARPCAGIHVFARDKDVNGRTSPAMTKK